MVWHRLPDAAVKALRQAFQEYGRGQRLRLRLHRPQTGESRLRGAALSVHCGWTFSGLCGRRALTGKPWRLCSTRAQRLEMSELLKIGHKLAIDEWRSHHRGRQVVMHRRQVGAFGLLSSAIFTSATLNLLGDDGCVVEHTDRDAGLSVILSFDVGLTPSNARLRTSTATYRTGAIATVDTTKPHSVTNGNTTTGALRASLTFYTKRSVVTHAGGRAMPHRERRLGSSQPGRRGGDVAPPLARGACVSVRMDSAGARTRARWYGGVVVAHAEALDAHTVRFDDGEQMTLPLVSLIRCGEARRGV